VDVPSGMATAVECSATKRLSGASYRIIQTSCPGVQPLTSHWVRSGSTWVIEARETSLASTVTPSPVRAYRVRIAPRDKVPAVVVGLAGVTVVAHEVFSQSKVVDGSEALSNGLVLVDDLAKGVVPQAARIDAMLATSTHATPCRGPTAKTLALDGPSAECGCRPGIGRTDDGGKGPGISGIPCTTRPEVDWTGLRRPGSG
jgi:hypothetical protein